LETKPAFADAEIDQKVLEGWWATNHAVVVPELFRGGVTTLGYS